MAITHHDTNVAGTGALPVDTLDSDPGSTHRARQVVVIGHPDGATPDRYMLPDSHGSGQVVPYDAAGNPLLVNPTDAQAATDMLATASMRWNGTTWDRWYNGNNAIALAASASRTTLLTIPVTAYNWSGMLFNVNVTLIPGSAPSLNFQLYEQGGVALLCLATVLITATGTYTYYVANVASATLPSGSTLTQIFPISLPGKFFLVITHGNANAVTYSITGTPIVNS